MKKTTQPIKYTDMEQTFTIDGTSYTEKKLVGILRGQLKGLKKYAHFAEQNCSAGVFIGRDRGRRSQRELFRDFRAQI